MIDAPPFGASAGGTAFGGVVVIFAAVIGIEVFHPGDAGNELVDFLDHQRAAIADFWSEQELSAEDRGEASGGGVAWVALVFFLSAHAFCQIPFKGGVVGGGVVDGGQGHSWLAVSHWDIGKGSFRGGVDVEFGGFVVGPKGHPCDRDIGLALGGFFFACGDEHFDIAR